MSVTRFTDIFGQPDAIAWLTAAYESDRLPHGLLFAGPAGVGKGTTAHALAALFLCEKPNGVEPCGKCESCRLFTANNHPDYTVIYRQLVRLEKEESKARDLTVDLIRHYLVAKAGLKPMMNRGRVFVIEEAETMNAAAQNSLLKTLEEPYGRTLIILLTDSPDSLLQTIRSRTQLVRFGALDPAVVAKKLVERGIDKPIAQQAADMSEGSLGVAIRWIEDGVITTANDLTHQLDSLLSGKPHANLADWFKSAAEAYSKKQQERDEYVSLDQTKREGLSLYLRLTAQRFRRVLRESSDSEVLDRACTAIETIARADDYLGANVNTAILFQQLSMTLERVCV